MLIHTHVYICIYPRTFHIYIHTPNMRRKEKYYSMSHAHNSFHQLAIHPHIRAKKMVIHAEQLQRSVLGMYAVSVSSAATASGRNSEQSARFNLLYE